MIKKNLFKNIIFKFSTLSATINLKPKELELEAGQKCLCLAPHADDESIGMGGLLTLYPNLFDVILLTDGKKGAKHIPAEEVVETRENEFKTAMNIAGIDNYSFVKAPDKGLLDSFDIFKKIDLSKYDYIFMPNIIDQHPDHKAVSLLLKRLLDEGAKVKPDLQICFYEVWSTLALPNAFVNITEAAENKKNMINCYKSQIATKDYAYHALGLNQYRGMFKDKKFVEAFCVLGVAEFKKMCELS